LKFWRKRCLSLLILIAMTAVLLLHFDDVEATQSRIDLSSKSDLIVDGEVKSIKSHKEADLIYSHVKFLVQEVKKGSSSTKGKEIIVKYIGGEVETGKVMWRSDQPHFTVGETARLYLRQRNDVFEVVQGPVGKIRLDKTSLEPVVERTAAGYKLW